MANNQVHPKEFIVGATLGGVLGTVSALLLAPKAGRKLRQELCGICSDVSEKTHDIADTVSRKSRAFAKTVGGARQHNTSAFASFADRAKDIVSDVAEWVRPSEEEETTNGLVWGGVLGSVLGAAAGLLMAPKAGADLRQTIADTYEDVTEKTQNGINRFTKKSRSFAKNASKTTNKWVDFAQDVIEEFSGEATGKGQKIMDKLQDLVSSNKIQEALEWANVGYRFWQHAKKRR